MVRVGFSHCTSLPARIAITLIWRVPVVRRGDHHRVDVVAGEHFAEIGEGLQSVLL